MRTNGGMEAGLHAFFTLAPNKNKLLAWRSGSFERAIIVQYTGASREGVKTRNVSGPRWESNPMTRLSRAWPGYWPHPPGSLLASIQFGHAVCLSAVNTQAKKTVKLSAVVQGCAPRSGDKLTVLENGVLGRLRRPKEKWRKTRAGKNTQQGTSQFVVHSAILGTPNRRTSQIARHVARRN